MLVIDGATYPERGLDSCYLDNKCWTLMRSNAGEDVPVRYRLDL